MWISGVSRANTILRDIANIACTAYQEIDPTKDWTLSYPQRPAASYTVTEETLTADSSRITYSARNGNWDSTADVQVMVDTVLLAKTDSNGNNNYTVNYAKGQITFPAALHENALVQADYTWTNDEFHESLAAITNRVVLKTTTTKLTIDPTADPFGMDPDLSTSQITMYLEIEKPARLVHPETDEEECLLHDGTVMGTSENHHYMNWRIFDQIDPATGEPAEGAHVSEWAKFAWFQDFREMTRDHKGNKLINSTFKDSLQLMEQVRTVGLDGDAAIQFWANVNNDRMILVLMGDPGIDYNNFLISFGYVGKIDSFDGAINDTAGNFALTVSSSTVPVKSSRAPREKATVLAAQVPDSTGQLSEGYHHCYMVTWINKDGAESVPSEFSEVIPSDGDSTAEKNSTVRLSLQLPEGAAGYKIYRADFPVGTTQYNDPTLNQKQDVNNYIQIFASDDPTVLTYDDHGDQVSGFTPIRPRREGRSVEGVKRDLFNPNNITLLDGNGAVRGYHFSDRWGQNTATGVTDVAMYKTRSGQFFQKHFPAFVTPEEYIPKQFYSPSRWTGKFHLSPVYVVHGHDGYRGMLNDVVAVDADSVIHLDDLVVTKDGTKTTYKYFKLNAPFSFLTGSGNASYGLAVRVETTQPTTA